MAFPVSPTNGSTAVVNGIVYLYSSADNAWTRFSSPPGNLTVTSNLTSSGNLIASNLYVSNFLSLGSGLVQQDVLNLNNNNLYGVNTIRINDPGTSEGIAWEGGSGWNIYESPNDLSNNTGNLQIVLSGTRVFTVDTNQAVNIPGTRAATSTTTGALTVGGGVGIEGNLWVGGNIYVANLVSIGSSTITVLDPLLYLSATSPFPYNYDIGFFSQFVGGSSINQHTGFSRNYTDNTWTLFSNVFAEPGITINWTDANIIFDPIKVGSANIANTTISTSTTTGALTVAGGVGVAGNVYADTIYTTTGIRWAGNGVAFSSGGGGGADEILRANVGAYQLYANANIGTLFLGNASTQANIGSFYTYANTTFTTLDANVGTLFLSNVSTQANLGAFQTYSNTTFATLDANIGTLFLGNASTQANIAAFYAYANTKIGTNDNGNLVIGATTTSTSKTTGALVVAGGAGISGNVYANRVYSTQGLFWAGNGFAISTGGGGGGGSAAGNNGSLQFNDSGTFNGTTIIYDSATGNVVITDTTDSTSSTTGALVIKGGVGVAGNINADRVYTTTGLYWAGNNQLVVGDGINMTVASSPPGGAEVGDQWYDTADGILFEYLDDGDSLQWVDITSAAIAANSVINLSSGDLSILGHVTPGLNGVYDLGNVNYKWRDVYAGNVSSISGYFWANGAPAVYSNTAVAQYLPVHTGNLSAGNANINGTITTTSGLFWANGTPYTAGRQATSYSMNMIFGI